MVEAIGMGDMEVTMTMGGKNIDNFLKMFCTFLIFSITFDGDVLFELSPMFLTAHNPSQMQGMDKKYDGHVWCKLVTTNTKILFGLNFRKGCCLGHLRYVQDDYNNFVHSSSCNETFLCGECAHIPVIGQMTMILSTFLFGCKFYHAPPFCVVDHNEQIYYVVHILQFTL